MPEKKRKTRRDVKETEKARRELSPAGELIRRGYVASLPPKLTLQTLTAGIALSTLNAKIIIDTEAVRARKSIYEEDEVMKNLPLTTFDISEVEVELKFAVEGMKGKDVIVSTEVEKLEKIKDTLSTVRFKLKSKPVLEYTLPDGKKF